MNILLLPGSLRRESLNKKLLQALPALLPSSAMAELVDLKVLGIPLYDGDLEQEKFPDGVNLLGKKIKEASALIIASPEYNGSISSPLKNTIDWLSRLNPIPLANKPILMMAASPGALGGIRALGHARQPLENLGAYLYPQSFGLAKAHEAFQATGPFVDVKTEERVRTLLKNFLVFTQKFQ